MKTISFQTLVQSIAWTGDPRADMVAFLQRYDCHETEHHCLNVAVKARELAERFAANPVHAELSGWLHDISAVIPKSQYLKTARELCIEVLPEEEQLPMLLHQKLSAVFAHKLFHVDEKDVLSAIGCHTTLKRDMALLDKIVFLADKIAWDQSGTPPYLNDLLQALHHSQSLDVAAKVYCDYLLENRNDHFIAHPWLLDAYQILGRS